MTTPESERAYSSGYGRRLSTIAWGLIGTAAVGFGIAFIMLYGWMGIRDQRILVGCAIAILVIGIVLILRRILVTGPVRFVTTPSTVKLYRGGRLTDSWPRATTKFSSSSELQDPLGERGLTAVDRKVIATTATERVETICNWFSPEEFNALAESLNPAVSAYSAPSRVGAGQTFGSYTLDPALFSPARRTGVLITALYFALAIGFGVAALMARDYQIFGIIAVASFFVTMTAGIPILSRLRRESGIPRSISITASALHFDDRIFSITDLRSIIVTPPSYLAGMRWIVLVTTSGRRTRIRLGMPESVPGIRPKTHAPFGDYADFVEILAFASAHRPGLFALDKAYA